MFLKSFDLSFLLELDFELKRKTVQWYSKSTNRIYTEYSPWMCNPKIIKTDLIDQSLLLETGNQIITNTKYLQLANDFLTDTLNPVGKNARINSGMEYGLILNIEQLVSSSNSLLNACSYIHSDIYLSKVWSTFIQEVLPFKMKPNKDNFAIAISSDFARGLIATTTFGFSHPVYLAISLVHEMAHHVLMAINSIDPLVSDRQEMSYSSIKKCDRPIIQSLHACAALSFMIYFCECLEKNNKNTEVSEQIVTLKDKYKIQMFETGENILCKSKSLTNLGRSFLEESMEGVNTK